MPLQDWRMAMSRFIIGFSDRLDGHFWKRRVHRIVNRLQHAYSTLFDHNFAWRSITVSHPARSRQNLSSCLVLAYPGNTFQLRPRFPQWLSLERHPVRVVHQPVQQDICCRRALHQPVPYNFPLWVIVKFGDGAIRQHSGLMHCEPFPCPQTGRYIQSGTRRRWCIDRVWSQFPLPAAIQKVLTCLRTERGAGYQHQNVLWPTSKMISPLTQ